ncbi:MAG: glycosyltransferase [Anaerolineae bacterium]|nr:glycosyltransferase [Anaerolineae bacterium]
MKRILFLSKCVPFASNFSGASARYQQNYRALADLGYAIRVVRIDDSSTLNATHKSEMDLQIPPPPSFDEAYAQNARPRNRWGRLSRLIRPFAHFFPEYRQVSAFIKRHMMEFSPDLMWVEGTELAISVLHCNPEQNWVYSHTDTLYHLYGIRQRQRGPSAWLEKQSLRRAEEQVFRRVPFFMTGSTSVVEWVTQFRNRPTQFIPITYDLIPPSSAPFAQTPRIVHLGSLETTANRAGLEGYLRKAHPAVQRESDLALTIVGDASRVKPPLSDLLRQAGATLVGYAPDLNTALRPGDLAILPYEHDTGYRTKLPLLLAYGQVVISTRAAVAGSMLPGLEDVCLIVDQVEEFPKVLIPLAKDESRRMSLSSAARRFFEAHFTHPCVLDSYRNLLKDLL